MRKEHLFQRDTVRQVIYELTIPYLESNHLHPKELENCTGIPASTTREAISKCSRKRAIASIQQDLLEEGVPPGEAERDAKYVYDDDPRWWNKFARGLAVENFLPPVAQEEFVFDFLGRLKILRELKALGESEGDREETDLYIKGLAVMYKSIDAKGAEARKARLSFIGFQNQAATT